jgi:hypothetical protein
MKKDIEKVDKCTLLQWVHYKRKSWIVSEAISYYKLYSYSKQEKKLFKTPKKAIDYINKNHKNEFVEFMNEKGGVFVLAYKDVFRGGEEIKNYGEFTGIIHKGKKYIQGEGCYYIMDCKNILDANKRLYIDEKKDLVFEYDKLKSAMTENKVNSFYHIYLNEGEEVFREEKNDN